MNRRKMPDRFKRLSYIILLTVIFYPPFVSAQSCPIPNPGETEKQLPREDQTEIPRGTCQYITLKGKMRYESVELSIDQSVGSGFHFDQDDGPTSIQVTGDQVLICSDNTACGSASIMVSNDGVPAEIGSVRSSYGYWVLKDNECFLSGPKTRMEGLSYVIELGGHKMMQYYRESYSMGSQAFKYVFYCDLGDGDCPTRCQQTSYCDPVVGCQECIDYEGFPDLQGEFPCKDTHYRWKQYYMSTLKCICTVRLQHFVYKCTNY